MDALTDTFCFFVILPHKGEMQQELEQRNIPYAIIHQYGWTNIYPWWYVVKWAKVFCVALQQFGERCNCLKSKGIQLFVRTHLFLLLLVLQLNSNLYPTYGGSMSLARKISELQLVGDTKKFLYGGCKGE